MRSVLRSILLVSLSSGLVAGCGNKDEKRSVELANEAVGAAGQGRHAEAEELLEQATSAYRDNHSAWAMLGLSRDRQEKYKEAAEAYSEAVRVKDDDAMYHYKLGKAYWNSNNLAQAQTHLERAVQLNKRLYGAYFNLGMVYEAQGKPKEAAEAWTQSASLAPSFANPFIRLGIHYIKWDKLTEAISVLDQGRLHVSDKDDLTDIYYNLGLAYEKQASWDKAIEAYSNALAQVPNMDALRQRGFAYAEKGDTTNAKKDLQAFVDKGGGGDAFQLQAANQRLFRLNSEE